MAVGDCNTVALGSARTQALRTGMTVPYPINGTTSEGERYAVAAETTLTVFSPRTVNVQAQVRVMAARAESAYLFVYQGGQNYPAGWIDNGTQIAQFELGAPDSLGVSTSNVLTTTYQPGGSGTLLFAIVVLAKPGKTLVQPIGSPPLSQTGGTYSQAKTGAGLAVWQGDPGPYQGTTDFSTPVRYLAQTDYNDYSQTEERPYPITTGDGLVVLPVWLDNVVAEPATEAAAAQGYPPRYDMIAVGFQGCVSATAGGAVSQQLKAYRPNEIASALAGNWLTVGEQIGATANAPTLGGDDVERTLYQVYCSENFRADTSGRWLLALILSGPDIRQPVITRPEDNCSNMYSGGAVQAYDDLSTHIGFAPDDITPDDQQEGDDTPPDEEPPDDPGEVFDAGGGDYSEEIPCPPHYRRRVATHAPSAVPRLGKAAEYRVQINRRGGGIQELDIPPGAIESVSWERRVNDVAEHTITVAKRWPDALRAIELTECWTHELAIWRVPERGQPEVVALGPLVDYTESRTTLTLVANDMGAWFGKRVIHRDFTFDGCTDLAEIARVLINDGLGPDDPGLLPYATFIPTGITATRAGAAFRLNLDKELGDMAEQGLDWTFVGRRLYVSGDLAAQWPHVARLGEQHFDQDVEINGAGKEALTRKFVTNAESDQVYIGVAGGVDEALGLLENTDNSDDVSDNQTARTAAKVALAAAYPVPYYVRVPDGASLTADAPVTIGQLIPGVGISVEITSYLKPRIGLQRLTQVRTTWNAEEGEQIAVSLSPWAGVVEADDVARVATSDELGLTDADVETDPDPVAVDDTDTTEGTPATQPTEPVYGDKTIGEVRSAANLGHFGSTLEVSYPDETVFKDQWAGSNDYPGRYSFPFMLATKTLYMIAGDRLYTTGEFYYFEALGAGQLSLQIWIIAGDSIALGQGNKEFEGAYKTVDNPSDSPDDDQHGFTLLSLMDTGRWPNPEFGDSLFHYRGWCPFDVPATGIYTLGLVATGPAAGWQHSPALRQNIPSGSKGTLYTARRTPRTETQVTPGKAVTLTMTVQVPRGGIYTLSGQQWIGATTAAGGDVSCFVFMIEGDTAPSSADLTNPTDDMNRWSYMTGSTVSAPGDGAATFSWGPSPLPNYYTGTVTYTFFIACYGAKEWDDGTGPDKTRYLVLDGKNVLLEEGSSGEAGTDTTTDPTIHPIGPTDDADTQVNATATTDDGTLGAPDTDDDDDDMSTNPRADPQTSGIGGPETPTDSSL